MNNSDENCSENNWNGLTKLMMLGKMEFNDFADVNDAVTMWSVERQYHL